MRPVMAGHLRIKDLDSTEYTLLHIVELNEAMDVRAENENRAHQAATRKK